MGTYSTVAPKACGHVFSLLIDQKAWLCMDGKLVQQQEACRAIGIQKADFDRFLREYAHGMGDPICFLPQDVLQAQVQMVCMCGFANAIRNETQQKKKGNCV